MHTFRVKRVSTAAHHNVKISSPVETHRASQHEDGGVLPLEPVAISPQGVDDAPQLGSDLRSRAAVPVQVAPSRAFVFKFKNEATVPVNLLGISTLLRAHGEEHNTIMPGQQVEMTTVLAWYDIYLSITRDNRWVQADQVAWGLAKDAGAAGVGALVGAGVFGPIAAASGAAVAGVVGVVVAPPVAVALGVVALAGVGIASSLAVSQICENLAEALNDARKALMARQASLPQEHRARPGFFRFPDVVLDPDVRRAFAYSMLRDRPAVSLSDVIMNEASAMAYYSATQAISSAQFLGREGTRTFTISGGFKWATQNVTENDVGFMPLDLKEDQADHGCLVNRDDKNHWQKKMSACKQQCARQGPANLRPQCLADCQNFLRQAVDAEQHVNSRLKELELYVGKKVQITTNEKMILARCRAAGIMNPTNDDYRRSAAGRTVTVRRVDLKDLTALLPVGKMVGGIAHSIYFPLEALLYEESPVMAEAERIHLLQNLRLGECWAKKEGGMLQSLHRFAGSIPWSYVSGQWAAEDFKMHFGQVCSDSAAVSSQLQVSSQDECDFPNGAARWYWVD